MAKTPMPKGPKVYVGEYERMEQWTKGGDFKELTPRDVLIVYSKGGKKPSGNVRMAFKKVQDDNLCTVVFLAHLEQLSNEDQKTFLINKVNEYSSTKLLVVVLNSMAIREDWEGVVCNGLAKRKTIGIRGTASYLITPDECRVLNAAFEAKRDNKVFDINIEDESVAEDEKKAREAEEKIMNANSLAGEKDNNSSDTATSKQQKCQEHKEKNQSSEEDVFSGVNHPENTGNETEANSKNVSNKRANQKTSRQKPNQNLRNSIPRSSIRNVLDSTQNDFMRMDDDAESKKDVKSGNHKNENTGHDTRNTRQSNKDKQDERANTHPNNSQRVNASTQNRDNNRDNAPKQDYNRINEVDEKDEKMRILEKKIFGAGGPVDKKERTFSEYDDQRASLIEMRAQIFIDGTKKLLPKIKEYDFTYDLYMDLIAVLTTSNGLENFIQNWSVVNPGYDLSMSGEQYKGLKEDADYFSTLCDMLYGFDPGYQG